MLVSDCLMSALGCLEWIARDGCSSVRTDWNGGSGF
jgi:hypothetical protein